MKIEMKHIFVRRQKGAPYKLPSYFHGKNYMDDDMHKIQQKENAYVVSFVSTNNNMIKDGADLEHQIKEILNSR